MSEPVEPRYFVQGETVRGEPRIYFVSDRNGKHYASEVTLDQRQARRWRDQMNAAEQRSAHIAGQREGQT